MSEIRIVISAPQGCGKTKIADAIADAISQLGFAIERKSEGGVFETNRARYPELQCVLIDEQQSAASFHANCTVTIDDPDNGGSAPGAWRAEASESACQTCRQRICGHNDAEYQGIAE